MCSPGPREQACVWELRENVHDWCVFVWLFGTRDPEGTKAAAVRGPGHAPQDPARVGPEGGRGCVLWGAWVDKAQARWSA